MKVTLGEHIDDTKESKMREIRALMCINWQVMLKECELIERAIIELHKHYVEDSLPCSDEDR